MNESYLSLVTSEYSNSVNFNKMLDMMLSYMNPVISLLESFDTLFNLDIAVGDQLDKLGQILSLSRELPIVDEDIPQVLDDELYRLVLKARILSNFWDGTMQTFEQMLQLSFPSSSYQIVDFQNMTVNIVIVDATISKQMIALLFNGYILPKPSGVQLVYTIQEKPLFGFDSDTAFVKGWEQGTWTES